MRRAALLVVSAIVAVSASSAAASDRTSCPNGFFDWPVPQTEQEMRVLPRIDAGLDAGAYSVQELIDLGKVRCERRRRLLPKSSVQPQRQQRQELGLLLRGA